MRYSLRHHITRAELAIYSPLGVPLAVGDILHFPKQSYKIERFEHFTFEDTHDLTLIMVSLVYAPGNKVDTGRNGYYFYARVSRHKGETNFMRDISRSNQMIVLTQDSCYSVPNALLHYGLYHYLEGVSAHLMATWTSERGTPPSLLLSTAELEELTETPFHAF